MTVASAPRIRKARKLTGRSVALRNAEVGDALFILTLRVDPGRSRFLSPTPPDLDEQHRWLKTYARATDQAYFIVESQDGEALGTVRLYDLRGNSFCWGSWIMKPEAPKAAALESALVVHAYALDHLGLRNSHISVRKPNAGVWRFLERFGAQRVREDDVDYHYTQTYEEIRAGMKRYEKYLGPIVVQSMF